jgi:cell division septum initiation protein DivIVA
MEPDSARAFSRTLGGYKRAAVDAYIEMLNTKQQLLLDDVESLRARLKDLDDESVELRKEVTLLTDTSPSPHAVQQRMAKMLRQAVDEIAKMQAEAQAEAAALIAEARAEADAEQRKHQEALADLGAQLNARQAEYQEAKAKVAAELDKMTAENQSAIADAWEDAQEERAQLLADAKQEADHYREQARLAVDATSQKRIDILERLMGVYRDLEGVPATLESAYQELKNPEEASDEESSDEKVSAD